MAVYFFLHLRFFLNPPLHCVSNTFACTNFYAQNISPVVELAPSTESHGNAGLIPIWVHVCISRPSPHNTQRITYSSTKGLNAFEKKPIVISKPSTSGFMLA